MRWSSEFPEMRYALPLAWLLFTNLGARVQLVPRLGFAYHTLAFLIITVENRQCNPQSIFGFWSSIQELEYTTTGSPHPCFLRSSVMDSLTIPAPQ